MKRRKEMIADAMVEQAAKALVSGSRFQVREDVIGDENDIRRLLNKLAASCGAHISANKHKGLLTFYNDDTDGGTSVVVATVE
jgi:hypothetical protein